MKAISRLFSLLLCATAAMPWLLARADAQSTGENICAVVAGRISPDISMQIKLAEHSAVQQMFENQIYSDCLQLRGQQGALGETAPANGPNTTNAGSFATFDVPGSNITGPSAVNSAVAVTGTYFDTAGLIHSFLRGSDGTIAAFDPPGAACSLSTQTVCSNASGIAPDGTIVGSYSDGSMVHGYLRAADGAFTAFDPPASTFTTPAAISPDGAVTGGFFSSGSFGSHGFLRAINGTFTTFDPVGSTYTGPVAINPAATITGFYIDASGALHGFLRASDGTITVFDPLGSISTQPAGINPQGVIAGTYEDASGTFHGFVRASDGTITTFDPSGSRQTVIFGINPAGTIIGNFITPDFSAQHGFLRANDGAITVFDPPGAVSTTPTGINPAGVITGYFFPPDFSAQHGFLGRP